MIPLEVAQMITVAGDSARFIAARDFLLKSRDDWQAAYEGFEWPHFESFNWALDYFDLIARNNEAPALRLVDDREGDLTITYSAMARRSSQVANFLVLQKVNPGERILIALGNCVALWESMLAAIKLGAVVIPATTLLGREDLRYRLEHAGVKCVITHSHLAPRFAGITAGATSISVGEAQPGWIDYGESVLAPERWERPAVNQANSPLLLYFTSGTTARPKLVEHSHVSYPVGHLSTMYWVGLKPGDVHLNLSSPGWAKHAWSCMFAPWNAESCVLAYQYDRFDARALLDQLVRSSVTTFCAPPTVWRMLIQHDLSAWRVTLREVVSAGEPLNAEVIDRVRDAWNLTIRDGFGQTETTAAVGNSPGQPVKAGSMGRPLPGYRIVLLDGEGNESGEGEICVDLSARPAGLMNGYSEDDAQTRMVMRDGFFHTGDVASRDAEGYYTYIGRTDDVFKSSDYRISPFELESVLIEHAAVAEAAVVPSPDALKLSVPKAFIVLAPGFEADAETARSIFQYVRERVSPYKRIRCIEFGELPKTISGKIRRVELRRVESQRTATDEARDNEYWEPGR
jgi:acetyl-CoA synthetase